MSAYAQQLRPLEFMPGAQNASFGKVDLQNAGRDIYDFRQTTVTHPQPPATFNITTSAANGTVYNGVFNGNEFYSGYGAHGMRPAPCHEPPRQYTPSTYHPDGSEDPERPFYHTLSPYDFPSPRRMKQKQWIRRHWTTHEPPQQNARYYGNEPVWTSPIPCAETEWLHRGGYPRPMDPQSRYFYSQ